MLPDRRPAIGGLSCNGSVPVKLVLFAAAAVLAASPALADCRSDINAQVEKVNAATQALNAQANAPMPDQCRTGKQLIADSKRLNTLYRTCRTAVKLTDEDLRQFDQRVQTADQDYAARCGG
jgi:hypothetical protein